MAKLTTKKRNKLSKSTFGLPDDKKYPMPDKAHAVNAKARAKQQLDKGNLSDAEYKKIMAKANKISPKPKSKKSKENKESKIRNELSAY